MYSRGRNNNCSNLRGIRLAQAGEGHTQCSNVLHVYIQMIRNHLILTLCTLEDILLQIRKGHAWSWVVGVKNKVSCVMTLLYYRYCPPRLLRRDFLTYAVCFAPFLQKCACSTYSYSACQKTLSVHDYFVLLTLVHMSHNVLQPEKD